MMDIISTVATESSGVQYDDWFLFGPSFAISQYSDIFDWGTINMQIEDGINVDDLVTETKYVIDGLKNGKVESLSRGEFEYESEYVAERHDLLDTSEHGGLRDMVKYAFDLSNYSRELRLLIEQHSISQLAALVGVSIVEGESQRFRDDDVWERCIELMAYFDPLLVEDMEQVQIRKERQSSIRERNTDWFEASNRWR